MCPVGSTDQVVFLRLNLVLGERGSEGVSQGGPGHLALLAFDAEVSLHHLSGSRIAAHSAQESQLGLCQAALQVLVYWATCTLLCLSASCPNHCLTTCLQLLQQRILRAGLGTGAALALLTAAVSGFCPGEMLWGVQGGSAVPTQLPFVRHV